MASGAFCRLSLSFACMRCLQYLVYLFLKLACRYVYIFASHERSLCFYVAHFNFKCLLFTDIFLFFRQIFWAKMNDDWAKSIPFCSPMVVLSSRFSIRSSQHRRFMLLFIIRNINAIIIMIMCMWYSNRAVFLSFKFYSDLSISWLLKCVWNSELILHIIGIGMWFSIRSISVCDCEEKEKQSIQIENFRFSNEYPYAEWFFFHFHLNISKRMHFTNEFISIKYNFNV